MPAGDTLLFFRPGGAWRLGRGSLAARIAELDFTLAGQAFPDLHVGTLGEQIEEDQAITLEGKVKGRTPWAEGDPTTWLVRVDWHGTPTVLFDKGSKRDPYLGWDFLDAEPVLDIRRAVDMPELSALLQGGSPPPRS